MGKFFERILERIWATVEKITGPKFLVPFLAALVLAFPAGFAIGFLAGFYGQKQMLLKIIQAEARAGKYDDWETRDY